jgi:serine/threonine protein kinase
MAMSHGCIVSVKETVIGDTVDKVFMVMEYMELDLQKAIERRSKIISDEMDDGIDIDHRTQPLQPSELKSVIQQILSGIHHILHYTSASVFHLSCTAQYLPLNDGMIVNPDAHKAHCTLNHKKNTCRPKRASFRALADKPGREANLVCHAE